MEILTLWAHESSPNLGVAALARGSRDLLKRVWPEANVVYANYGHRPPQLPFGRPRSLVKERVLNRFGMQEWLSRFDLVWDTRSGDSFTDIYGLGRLLTMSTVFELAVSAGATGVLAPQTIGPFRSRRARLLAGRTLRRASVVTARDRWSAESAARLGRPVDAVVSDLVFAIAPPTPDQARDVVLNVSGLLWSPNPHVDHRTYQEAVLTIARRLRSHGRAVSLMAHVRNSSDPDNDVPAVLECARQLPDDVETIIPDDLDQARSVLGSAELVVGARMHACLNALSSGVPAVAMAYSPKFSPLLGDLGWGHVVDLRAGTDADAVTSAVLAASAQPGLRDAAARARDRGRAQVEELASSLGALA